MKLQFFCELDLKKKTVEKTFFPNWCFDGSCWLQIACISTYAIQHSRRTHYVWFSWFWSHLKMSKNVFWVVARLPQRLKSTLFEIFSHSTDPFWAALLKKFQTTLILAFEANSALSRKNETKIVKITHSDTPRIQNWYFHVENKTEWQFATLEFWQEKLLCGLFSRGKRVKKYANQLFK